MQYQYRFGELRHCQRSWQESNLRQSGEHETHDYMGRNNVRSSDMTDHIIVMTGQNIASEMLSSHFTNDKYLWIFLQKNSKKLLTNQVISFDTARADTQIIFCEL